MLEGLEYDFTYMSNFVWCLVLIMVVVVTLRIALEVTYDIFSNWHLVIARELMWIKMHSLKYSKSTTK